MIYPGVGLIVVGLLVALALPHLWIGVPVVIVVLGWIAAVAGVCVLAWHLAPARRHPVDRGPR